MRIPTHLPLHTTLSRETVRLLSKGLIVPALFANYSHEGKIIPDSENRTLLTRVSGQGDCDFNRVSGIHRITKRVLLGLQHPPTTTIPIKRGVEQRFLIHKPWSGFALRSRDDAALERHLINIFFCILSLCRIHCPNTCLVASIWFASSATQFGTSKPYAVYNGLECPDTAENPQWIYIIQRSSTPTTTIIILLNVWVLRSSQGAVLNNLWARDRLVRDKFLESVCCKWYCQRHRLGTPIIQSAQSLAIYWFIEPHTSSDLERVWFPRYIQTGKVSETENIAFQLRGSFHVEIIQCSRNTLPYPFFRKQSLEFSRFYVIGLDHVLAKNSDTWASNTDLSR